MVDDATIISVCSSSKTPLSGERVKALSTREARLENTKLLSKRSATVKKVTHKCSKAKGNNESKKESERQTK